MTQGSMRFYNQLSYHEYSGRAETEEWDELQHSLGDNKAMILKHHGLLTCGENIAEAISLMLYLYDACKSQLLLEAAVGRENVMVPNADVCARAGARARAYGLESSLYEWPAMLRWAERLDPSFRA